MSFVKKIDSSLHRAINDIVANKEKYVKNPIVDFTRKRKITMKETITQILSMNGGSLKKELYDLSKIKKTTLTPSAFVQQRSKILSDAFKDIFYHFNKNCNDSKTYRGYRLIAVDGSDIALPRNPQSPSFLSTSVYPKGHNQTHLNALYDICNQTYIDIEILPPCLADERQALINMLKRNSFKEKAIVITDRGYESYNMFAHLINTDHVDFLCRVKNGHGAILEISKLPKQELDTDIEIEITTTQTNEDKRRGRRFIQTASKFGKINSPKTRIGKWDFLSPYTLKFRAVQILLDSGEYETLVTSLDRDQFPIEATWVISSSRRKRKNWLSVVTKKSNRL